jgi:hypothetical protein
VEERMARYLKRKETGCILSGSCTVMNFAGSITDTALRKCKIIDIKKQNVMHSVFSL